MKKSYHSTAAPAEAMTAIFRLGPLAAILDADIDSPPGALHGAPGERDHSSRSAVNHCTTIKAELYFIRLESRRHSVLALIGRPRAGQVIIRFGGVRLGKALADTPP